MWCPRTHTRISARRSLQLSRRPDRRISASAAVTSTGTARTLLLELYDAAVAAAAPGAATARAIDALELGRARRVWLFAIGKAARPMAAAAVRSLQRGLHSIIGGVVVAPDDGTAPDPTLVSLRGDHPTPGRLSFEAAVKIGEVAARRRVRADRCLSLIHISEPT